MKKVLAILLSLLLLLVFSACSADSLPSVSTSSVSSGVKEAASSKEESESSVAEPSSALEPAESEEPELEAPVFEQVIVVDNDECVVKIVDNDPHALFGYTLKAYLENKSSEKTYMFSVVSAAVNNVASDPLFATEVAPGKKSNSDISFTDSELSKNGIKDFTDIELTFKVYDSNDWLADPVALETTHIYPYGKDKATSFVRASQPSDKVLFDNDQVTVTVTGYENDTLFGYAVNLYLINKTDKELMFSVDDASINGFMAEPFWAKSVIPGKCAFSSMTWLNSTLEENGINSVDEIEMTFRVYDVNNWMGDDILNEVVTLNP